MVRVELIEKTTTKFGLPDIERIGLFIEMPYMKPGQPPPAARKEKRNLLPGYPKSKCGTMDGYFADTYRRLFIGERPHVAKRHIKKKDEKEQLPFVPNGPGKKHSCPGDYFGTFSGTITTFSPKTRKKPKFVPSKRNPQTSLGKKGGPGYIDITIGPYPEYHPVRFRRPKKYKGPKRPAVVQMHFPQPYFDPNPYTDPLNDPPEGRLYKFKRDKIYIKSKRLKGRPTFMPAAPGKRMGGCKAGCFDKWTEWVHEKYLTKKQILDFVPRNLRKIKKRSKKKPFSLSGQFYPQQMAEKSMFTHSILFDTKFRVNNDNWKVYEPTYINDLL